MVIFSVRVRDGSHNQRGLKHENRKDVDRAGHRNRAPCECEAGFESPTPFEVNPQGWKERRTVKVKDIERIKALLSTGEDILVEMALERLDELADSERQHTAPAREASVKNGDLRRAVVRRHPGHRRRLPPFKGGGLVVYENRKTRITTDEVRQARKAYLAGQGVDYIARRLRSMFVVAKDVLLGARPFDEVSFEPGEQEAIVERMGTHSKHPRN